MKLKGTKYQNLIELVKEFLSVLNFKFFSQNFSELRICSKFTEEVSIFPKISLAPQIQIMNKHPTEKMAKCRNQNFQGSCELVTRAQITHCLKRILFASHLYFHRPTLPRTLTARLFSNRRRTTWWKNCAARQGFPLSCSKFTLFENDCLANFCLGNI
jgi:hypothetical protein